MSATDAVFNKCPEFDRDLTEMAKVNPDFKKLFFGENRKYKDTVTGLANLKTEYMPVDGKESTDIKYEFSEEEIKTIVEAYKEDKWNTGNIQEVIKTSREEEQKEKNYVNNYVREWKKYEVPVIDSKEQYRIDNYGIIRVIETKGEDGEPVFTSKEVCRTPFVICGISEPIKDDQIYFKIRFPHVTGKLKEFWASQSTLLSRRELKTLFLSKGINCPENNLLVETIDYISRSIYEFSSRLKKEFSAKQTGWNEDKTVFVLGNRGISAKGIEPVLSVDAGKGFPELEKKGDLKGWVEGTKEIFEYDVIRFKCYDALTAPLKALLGIESHVTDHYGNTSTGKTLSAQVALSMIGNPEGLTIGAKGTAKGILVHIRDFSDLPILIDESSDAGEHIADLVYPLTSNKGRVKSTVDGQRDGGEEFHTTTMFTGERPIRDCLPNSGQQYRVNELDDTLPGLETKKIKEIKKAIRENHGYVIELYLKKIIEMHVDGSLQEIYDTSFDKLPATTSNIEGRSRSIFACIMTAGYILEQIFIEIEMPVKKAIPIVQKYYKNCILQKPVELEYIRALRIVLDWTNSEYGCFARYNRESDCLESSNKNKTYGFVDTDYIDIIGSEFTKKMKENGFSPSKIKEDWYKQGITLSNDEIRPGYYRTSKKGYGSFVGIRINRSIAEEIIGYKNRGESNEEDIPELCQFEKIRLILETIQFLTKVKKQADVQLIRQIVSLEDLDEILNILSKNGKILKVSQTTYKTV